MVLNLFASFFGERFEIYSHPFAFLWRISGAKVTAPSAIFSPASSELQSPELMAEAPEFGQGGSGPPLQPPPGFAPPRGPPPRGQHTIHLMERMMREMRRRG